MSVFQRTCFPGVSSYLVSVSSFHRVSVFSEMSVTFSKWFCARTGCKRTCVCTRVVMLRSQYQRGENTRTVSEKQHVSVIDILIRHWLWLKRLQKKHNSIFSLLQKKPQLKIDFVKMCELCDLHASDEAKSARNVLYAKVYGRRHACTTTFRLCGFLLWHCRCFRVVVFFVTSSAKIIQKSAFTKKAHLRFCF